MSGSPAPPPRAARMDWDSWAADIAREDSVVSRGSLRSRSRSPSPLRDASSPVGRLRRVKLPPSRERPLSPTREELVLLSTPHRQQHRRRRRTPPAGRLEPLLDPNEPPELAAIRRDRAVKGAPGLYGAPADQRSCSRRASRHLHMVLKTSPLHHLCTRAGARRRRREQGAGPANQ